MIEVVVDRDVSSTLTNQRKDGLGFGIIAGVSTLGDGAGSMDLSTLPEAAELQSRTRSGSRLANARESGMRMINPTIATTTTMTTTRGSLKL